MLALVLIVRVMILIGLIRLLHATDKPFLCAGVYVGMHLGLDLAIGAPVATAFLCAGIAFALASLYFWLLYRFEGSGGLYVLILIGGVVIGLV